MLVTQKQLDGEHEFEFKIQETGSKGRGKIYNVYREPGKIEGEAFLVFKLALVQKLYAVADRLRDSIQSGGKKKKKAVEVDAVYEAIVPPVSYEAPAMADSKPRTVIETRPQTRMEGGYRWQGSADVEAKTVMEQVPRTVLEN